VFGSLVAGRFHAGLGAPDTLRIGIAPARAKIGECSGFFWGGRVVGKSEIRNPKSEIFGGPDGEGRLRAWRETLNFCGAGGGLLDDFGVKNRVFDSASQRCSGSRGVF